ncbi:response regulator [Yoonia vestfoldensis]|uniref:response regulator n=1 Tax=Yoonia vestfoldensis TaxID=245188 RepID=UPI00036DFF4F|nr:response regulator [Yoonia vestfoldensis]
MDDQIPPATALAGKKILIVEDEMLLALDLQLLLEDEGCEVLGPVQDAKRALEMLADNRPDAATLDMNLNGRSSAPIAVALREKGIPYVVISGYSAPPDAEPALRDVQLLAKPISNALLLRELAALLDGSARA